MESKQGMGGVKNKIRIEGGVECIVLSHGRLVIKMILG